MKGLGGGGGGNASVRSVRRSGPVSCLLVPWYVRASPASTGVHGMQSKTSPK